MGMRQKMYCLGNFDPNCVPRKHKGTDQSFTSGHYGYVRLPIFVLGP